MRCCWRLTFFLGAAASSGADDSGLLGLLPNSLRMLDLRLWVGLVPVCAAESLSLLWCRKPLIRRPPASLKPPPEWLLEDDFSAASAAASRSSNAASSSSAMSKAPSSLLLSSANGSMTPSTGALRPASMSLRSESLLWCCRAGRLAFFPFLGMAIRRES